MSESWFCPRCRSPLPGGAGTLRCPVCEAEFGPQAEFGPVTNDMGIWTPRVDPERERRAGGSIGRAVLSLIVRAVLVVIAAVAVIALAFLSAMPYGGGGSGFLLLAWFILIGGAVWAVAPLLRVLYHRIAGAARD